jgi:hypothetical protein
MSSAWSITLTQARGAATYKLKREQSLSSFSANMNYSPHPGLTKLFYLFPFNYMSHMKKKSFYPFGFHESFFSFAI